MKTSGTARTATEQMILSDAMDRAVAQADFRVLAGRNVFIDTTYLKGVDSDYLISLVRQHALNSGCRVENTRDEAEYIVELRAGSVGTDQHDLLVGVPETSLPYAIPGMSISMIPEIPLVKKNTQKAVVKLGIFAYHAKTGRPLWQSGNLIAQSNAKNTWFFGLGPIQSGEIYSRSTIAGMEMEIPLTLGSRHESTPVSEEIFFVVPPEMEQKNASAVPVPTPPAADGETTPKDPFPAVVAPQIGGGAEGIFRGQNLVGQDSEIPKIGGWVPEALKI